MPNPTEASGLFWATVFGAALGVIAGTVVQYLLTFALDRRSKRRQKTALMKELIYNQNLVNELLSEVQKLRNAVNGDVLSTYHGYLAYSKALFAQANACATNGLLYELLSVEDIRDAQRVVSTLSLSNENWVNAEVARRRNDAAQRPQGYDRAEAVKFVDFVDNQVADLRLTVDRLIAKLR